MVKKPEAPPATWERTPTRSPAIGVDRKARVIRGVVIAQAGAFKTAGRGEFDEKSLREIVRLMNAKRGGLKSRLSHPTLSDDGVGKLLGRMKNARLDTAKSASGATVAAVRADLHLDPTSFKTPSGNLGQYVMDLAESDPDAFSTSLVLHADKELRLDAKGRPAVDTNGKELPPIWRPKELHASDVVDTGDAVDGFLGKGSLSLEGLPDSLARHAAMAIDENFGSLSRDELVGKLKAYVHRYADWRYGEAGSSDDSKLKSDPVPTPTKRLTGREARKIVDAKVAEILGPKASIYSSRRQPATTQDAERLARARWEADNCDIWRQAECIGELRRLERLRAMSAQDVASLRERKDALESQLLGTPYGSDGVRLRIDSDLAEVNRTLKDLTQ